MAVERGRGRSSWASAAAVIGCMLLAACSTGNAKPTGSGTTSTVATTTSTTTVAQVEAIVVARWLAAGQAVLAAAKDPGNPVLILLLSDYFADPELTFLRTQFAANAGDGLKTVGTIDRGHPHVEKLTGTQAVVVSCGTDGAALVFAATGKPLDGPTVDTTPTPAGVRATMTLQPSGVWKESDTTGREGSCVGY